MPISTPPPQHSPLSLSPISSTTQSPWSYESSPTKSGGVRIPCLVNASVTLVERSDYSSIYIIGGFDKFTDEVFNTVYRMDLKAGHVSTRMVESHGTIPSPMLGHTATRLDDTLFVFGGETDIQFLSSNLYLYHLEAATWSLPEIKGPSQVPRSRHAAILDNLKLYIIGGRGELGVVLDDMQCLDLRTKRWRKPKPFVRRYGHQAFVYDDKVWVYGGIDEHSKRAEDIAWYDLRTDECARISIVHDIPHEPKGGHFYCHCGSSMLEIVTPGGALPRKDAYVAVLNLNTLRWRFAGDSEVFGATSYWQYLANSQKSTTAYLVGSSSENQEESLSEVLGIDFRRFGLLQERETKAESGTLGADWQGLLWQEDLSDFWITALDEDGSVTNPLKVHSLVLIARWPHFQRMYKSRMREIQDRGLHLPEPRAVAEAFITYLYTDSISDPAIRIVARLMVLANMYQMARLRTLCVSRVQNEIQVETAVVIWESARISGEVDVKRFAAHYCLKYWGRIVRTEGFRVLPKRSVLQLCSEAAEDGAVAPSSDVEDVDMSGDETDG